MPKPIPLPPPEELWRLLSYNPITGEVFWRVSNIRGHVKAGKRAGSYRHSNNHARICIKGTVYPLHRVIWAWVTGTDPGELTIDHKNLVRNDNRWGNLRLATYSQQVMNAPKQSTRKDRLPTSRYKGVTVRHRPGWKTEIVANICFDGVRVRLGSFATEEAAHAAYCKAAQLFHGEFARTT